MKDTEKIALIAFLFALQEQQHPLPAETIQSIQAVAIDLENRVWDLNAIACNSTELSEPYERAQSYFLRQAQVRGMGLDSLPAEDDGGASDREKTNTSHDVRPQLATMERFLSMIEAQYDRDLALAILSAPNPTEIARNVFS